MNTSHTDFSQLTQVEIADLHGVSDRQIRRWTAAGMPRGPHGNYNATATIEWRIRHVQERGALVLYTERPSA